MKKYILFCIFIISIYFSVSVYAEQTELTLASVKQNDSYVVTVTISENSSVCAGSFVINYDSTKLTLSNLKPTETLDNASVEYNEQYKKNQAKASFITFEPITANSSLFTFMLTPLRGTLETDISLTDIILADAEENTIQVASNVLTVGQTNKTSSGDSRSGGQSSVSDINGDNIPFEENSETVNKNNQSQTTYFIDLDNYSWAKEQILFLADNGIISGIGGNKFSPESNIKRGDFICMLMRMRMSMLGNESIHGEEFSDVHKDEYWYDAIMTARVMGIAEGYDNSFRPAEYITRQDMFSLVCRAFSLTDNADKAEYKDYAEISDYAQNSIDVMTAKGLIHGDNGYVNPKNNATRAETAVMLYNIYNTLKEETVK